MCRIMDSAKPCFSMLGVWTEMCCFHDITRCRKHDFRPPSTGTGYAMSTVCTHIPCSVYKYNTLYLVHYVQGHMYCTYHNSAFCILLCAHNMACISTVSQHHVVLKHALHVFCTLRTLNTSQHAMHLCVFPFQHMKYAVLEGVYSVQRISPCKRYQRATLAMQSTQCMLAHVFLFCMCYHIEYNMYSYYVHTTCSVQQYATGKSIHNVHA